MKKFLHRLFKKELEEFRLEILEAMIKGTRDQAANEIVADIREQYLRAIWGRK